MRRAKQSLRAINWRSVDEDERQEVDEEIRLILEERMATLDKDAKDSVDAREALVVIRRKIKRHGPEVASS
jgi:hypothetical protein